MADYKILPTRHGVAQGDSAENRMLARVGDVASFKTALQNNPDGSVTMLRTRGGAPEFTTIVYPKKTEETSLKWHMSSGAYDIGYVDVLAPSSTPGITNYKTSEVLGQEHGTFRNVAKKLFAVDPLTSGQLSREHTQQKKPGGALNVAKNSMYQHRPSTFSGLMQRMVQGQFGAGYSDCKSGPRPIFVAGSEDDARITLSNAFSSTTGVIKFGTYYVLAKLECAGGLLRVKLYPLEIPADLRIERNPTLIASGGLPDALEVLALANAKTDTSKELDLGSVEIPPGTSVNYGWNFSLTSNEASIVIREPLPFPGDRNNWSLLTVNFKLEIDPAKQALFGAAYKGDISFALKVVERRDGWMIRQLSPIWVSGDAETVAVNVIGSVIWPDAPQDFPVYAYYVKDDLKVVRWKYYGEYKEVDEAKWLADREKSIWENSVFGDGTVSGYVSQDFGNIVTHGFFVGGSQVLSQAAQRREESNTATMTAAYDYTPYTPPGALGPANYSIACSLMPYYTQVNPYTSPSGLLYPSTPFDGRPGDHYLHISYRGSTGGNTVEWSPGMAVTHVSALVIPYGDCSACYIGTAQDKSGVVNTSQYQYRTFRSGAQEIQLIPVDIYNAIYTPGDIWMQVEIQLAADGPHGTIENIVETTSATNEVREERTVDVRFHSDTTVAVSSTYSKLFHATVGDSALGHRVLSLGAGVSREKLYVSGGLTDAEAIATGGYPATIDAFIGIA